MQASAAGQAVNRTIGVLNHARLRVAPRKLVELIEESVVVARRVDLEQRATLIAAARISGTVEKSVRCEEQAGNRITSVCCRTNRKVMDHRNTSRWCEAVYHTTATAAPTASRAVEIASCLHHPAPWDPAMSGIEVVNHFNGSRRSHSEDRPLIECATVLRCAVKITVRSENEGKDRPPGNCSEKSKRSRGGDFICRRTLRNAIEISVVP